MRNIFALIYRLRGGIYFILLQAICFTLLFTYNSYHRTSYVNSSNRMIAWTYNVRNFFTEPFEAIEANKKLVVENARLRAQLKQSLRKIDNSTVVIDDTTYLQQYSYIPAKVINNKVNVQRNYLTISEGSNAGIEKGMGVIGPEGIVGFVYDVSPNYSVVIPVINPLFKTSAKIASNNYSGKLVWDGKKRTKAILNDIPSSVEVEKGDTLLSKSASGRYPTGIFVGTISKVERKAGKEFLDIEVKLGTSFQSLSYVYVISNMLAKEKAELEENVEAKLDPND